MVLERQQWPETRREKGELAIRRQGQPGGVQLARTIPATEKRSGKHVGQYGVRAGPSCPFTVQRLRVS